MSCRGLQEGNEEIMSTILKWLADECADKKHDGHDHEHLFAIASWSRRFVQAGRAHNARNLRA